MPNTITVDQAAEATERTPATIYRWLREGLLTERPIRDGGRTLKGVDSDELRGLFTESLDL